MVDEIACRLCTASPPAIVLKLITMDTISFIGVGSKVGVLVVLCKVLSKKL